MQNTKANFVILLLIVFLVANGIFAWRSYFVVENKLKALTPEPPNIIWSLDSLRNTGINPDPYLYTLPDGRKAELGFKRDHTVIWRVVVPGS